MEKNSILRKLYYIDLKKLGVRVADLSVATKDGGSPKMMETIVNNFSRHVVDIALRVGNPDTNISFRVAYKNSVEL